MTSLILSVLLLGLFALLLIPFLVVGVVIGSVVYAVGQLLLLPFRVLGWTAVVGAGLIVSFIKFFFFLLVMAFTVLAVVFGLLPLLSILLIGIGLWLILRPARRAPQRVAAT